MTMRMILEGVLGNCMNSMRTRKTKKMIKILSKKNWERMMSSKSVTAAARIV